MLIISNAISWAPFSLLSMDLYGVYAFQIVWSTLSKYIFGKKVSCHVFTLNVSGITFLSLSKNLLKLFRYLNYMMVMFNTQITLIDFPCQLLFFRIKAADGCSCLFQSLDCQLTGNSLNVKYSTRKDVPNNISSRIMIYLVCISKISLKITESFLHFCFFSPLKFLPSHNLTFFLYWVCKTEWKQEPRKL